MTRKHKQAYNRYRNLTPKGKIKFIKRKMAQFEKFLISTIKKEFRKKDDSLTFI